MKVINGMNKVKKNLNIKKYSRVKLISKKI